MVICKYYSKNKYLPLVKQKYVNDKKKKAIQKPFRVNTY